MAATLAAVPAARPLEIAEEGDQVVAPGAQAAAWRLAGPMLGVELLEPNSILLSMT